MRMMKGIISAPSKPFHDDNMMITVVAIMMFMKRKRVLMATQPACAGS